MKKIDHPNCVHLFDVIVDDAKDEILIVLEYVEGGVSQRTATDGGAAPPLDERVIWSHTRHLILGLEYLHMNGIVHKDIKPENLLVVDGGGVLKIADFGTSCFAEVEAGGKQSTVGTPSFFSPELCTMESSGTYDERAVDLWAVGVTLYLWVCGRLPFNAPTMMLLMQEIAAAPPVVAPPSEASSGLQQVIGGLLTRDLNARLTLNQLRHHSWITSNGRATLPDQPVAMITQATPEEIALAFTNREAMRYVSAAGPGTLGRDIGVVSDWRRDGPNTIVKRTTKVEANFWSAIASSGHLSPHIPVLYLIDSNEQSTMSEDARASAEEDDPHDGIHSVRMQDLASNMTRPCAMRFVMGSRTVVADDVADTPQARTADPALYARALETDSDAAARFATDEERAACSMTRGRYLAFLDQLSSTATLGFRIDSARSVVDDELADLPPPGEHTSLATLRTEADVAAALVSFLQSDAALAKGVVSKLQAITAALERSSFFARHIFLRSALLLTYDDANRSGRLELKMINFAFCYELPDGVPPSHDTAESVEGRLLWDGTTHSDGYMLGVRALTSIMQSVATSLAAENPESLVRASAKSRTSKFLDDDGEEKDSAGVSPHMKTPGAPPSALARSSGLKRAS